MDPDQNAPTDLDLHCLSKRLQLFQQTTKAYDFFCDMHFVEPLISHFLKFKSCEELVPIHRLWQM